MNIGIDVDGVLLEKCNFQIEEGTKFFNKRVINSKEYDIKKIFDISSLEYNKFWDVKIKEYIERPSIKYASEVIYKLKERGHKIYIITARGTATKNYTDTVDDDYMKTYLIKWLEMNNIYYDEVIFTSDGKVNDINKYKINYMIEDKPKNIIEISEVTNVIKYSSLYNLNVVGKNIIEAYSWYDILKIIEKN